MGNEDIGGKRSVIPALVASALREVANERRAIAELRRGREFVKSRIGGRQRRGKEWRFVSDEESLLPGGSDGRKCGLLNLFLSGMGEVETPKAGVIGGKVKLSFRDQCMEIAVRDIQVVRSEHNADRVDVSLEHEGRFSVVSGLQEGEASRFIEAVERQRLSWWTAALAGELESLSQVHERLRGFSDPVSYVRLDGMRDLVADAKDALMDFMQCWPEWIPDASHIDMVDGLLGFLEDPEQARARANEAFIAAELERCRDLFDRIEARPLSEEQRRAVVVDERRNLVVAAAGSGKTSVIVAKTAWLVRRGYRKPSELLLLAFARGARKEMQERLEKRLGDDAKGVTVRTFHALGMAIISEAEGKRPTLARSAMDEKALLELIKAIIAELLGDAKLSEVVLDWFQGQFAPYKSEHEFNNWGEYWNYIRGNQVISLKGDKVKSYEECEIANFLFLRGVEYRYGEDYEHELAKSKRGRYRPAFFLPDHAVYIEHCRLDADGNTASFVDREDYLEELEWKREVHQKNGTRLLETFSGERESGRMIARLQKRLLDLGVSLNRLSGLEVLGILEKQGRIDPFVRLVATFLQHFKGSRLSVNDIETRARWLGDEGRGQGFLTVFGPIIERYEATLSKRNEIDFHDMIARATDHVEAGRYTSPFGYILVDEFQDISPGRAKLLKALLDNSEGAQLCAVGDDWQAIYRFSGSDISVMRDFEEGFGRFERVDLTTTFRCVEHICEVGTEFVLRNAAQIEKVVRATHSSDKSAVYVGLPSDEEVGLLEQALDRIAEDAEEYEGRSDVLLLGRYRRNKPAEMEELEGKYPRLSLRFMTVHGAKGLEADYVVVLRLCSGKLGFPSEIVDDPLLGLVMGAPEAHPNAEERRLFYVALTRARRQVFLLAEGGPVSSFVSELMAAGRGILVFGRRPDADVRCSRCMEGRLQRRENAKTGRVFYGCSNWPYCEHSARPCPKCEKGLPVRMELGFCCSECGELLQGCPKCEGWLGKRTGRSGEFLACSNFPACKYTRNVVGGDRGRQGEETV